MYNELYMSHAKNKFVKASNQGSEPTAELFSNFKNIFNGCRDYVNMVPDKSLWRPAYVKFKTN